MNIPIGSQFGKLTVMGEHPVRISNQVAWECACACGNTTVVRGQLLRNGTTRSCGCARVQACRDNFKTHGATGTREYRCWLSIKRRCYQRGCKDFPDYGGRGITVCDRWKNDFPAFLADMGPCPPGFSIDRLDCNGNYEPANCRWESAVKQANNKRTNITVVLAGEAMTLSQAARTLGLNYQTLFWHVGYKGKRFEDAVAVMQKRKARSQDA